MENYDAKALMHQFIKFDSIMKQEMFKS